MLKLVLIVIMAAFTSLPALGATPVDLQKAIEDKNNELANIRNQIEQTQDKLYLISGQSRTLNKEIQKLDYALNQLNLGIRLSQVNIEKLTLELESLKGKKAKTEKNIDITKEAIARVLRELQQKENRSIIEIFLKNSTLAEGFLEIQTLNNLQGSLTVNSAELHKLSSDLGENIDESTRKKAELEIENRNLKNRKGIASDEKEDKASLLKQTKDQESLYQKQLKDLVNQQNLIADQIDAIEDELRRQLGPGFVPPRITGFFSWPVLLTQFGGAGRITQHYGERSYLYRGKPHNGLDIGAPAGTLVYAAADGQVMRVDNNDRNSWRKYQYGKYILIEHS
ncbi:MAG: peptidoglycan DD-metalloendopeptidase family protein, partial [Candidatus Colwellbacteria bacterium]|nr:peptidoglycan DD-metalloendopeptidase family protein [Candidatus Colwellbacteria bacterium]